MKFKIGDKVKLKTTGRIGTIIKKGCIYDWHINFGKIDICDTITYVKAYNDIEYYNEDILQLNIGQLQFNFMYESLIE